MVFGGVPPETRGYRFSDEKRQMKARCKNGLYAGAQSGACPPHLRSFLLIQDSQKP